jgi:steroid 5-alpha reductase family enzyme
MSPLLVVILISVALSTFAWIASLLTGATSWVDQLWSIAPIAYVWVFAGYAGLTDIRLDVMAALVTLWGVRLTFNLARKGGYTGVEDYRWQVLRDGMGRGQFQLFNFFFIVIYQNVILVLITLPALTAYQHRSTTPVGVLDWLLATLFLACTTGEALADQQQWDFQTRKRTQVATGRTPSPQFLQSGLFRFSRHPNYFFELAQWWIFFLFGAVAASSLLQWSVVGAFLLSVLFVGSTNFTEKITLSRYPEYEEYRRRTSPIVPWFSRSGAQDVHVI